MPKGGRREGAGRPKGSLNKATASVRDAAQVFTDEALGVLATVMRDAASPAASRVAAASALLDRGHGKPMQATEITGSEGGALLTRIELVGVPSDHREA